MKRPCLSTVIGTCLVAATLAVAPALGAAAASAAISGSTPESNKLVNYTVARYHAPGTISMAMTYVAPCGGTTALSLRTSSGTFSTSPTWKAPTGTKYFSLATSGSQLIPQKTFYVSARMVGACFVDYSQRYFSGTLVF
jgi:hypothetical protein